jgi:hypothetical protein
MASIPNASPLIRLHANDNVLIARSALALGQECREYAIRIRAQVPAGHKIAARRIAAGEPIRKFDTVIGAAQRDIEAGEHVHTHNVEIIDFDRDPGFCEDVRPVEYVPEPQRATFMGIVRPDGRVATRNFIGIFGGVIGPVVTGFIVATTGSFKMALVFSAALGVLGILNYAFLLRRIEPIRVMAPSGTVRIEAMSPSH